MKLPLNSSQTIAAVAVAVALLGGVYALGRSQGADKLAALPPPADAPPATQSAVLTEPKPGLKPEPVARAEPQAQPPQADAPFDDAKPAAPRLCNECARVVSVHSEVRKGEGSGLGAIGGAVVGGILGHQLGGGTGRKIATIGGAAAGGYAGNEIEKNSKSERIWIVRLKNSDGSTQTHRQAQDPGLHNGDIVVLRDGRLERR
ncbi:MAG: glycine zipper 2TM domain-containing protein [Burkholderiaceae bacterium]